MIPDFQTIMLPLLQELADGKERNIHELTDALAVKFNITEEERNELLPSGNQAIFTNRVAWAKTHLKKAGLIDSPRRAIVVISDKGKEVLQSGVTFINMKYLTRFPDYFDFQNSKKDKSDEKQENNFKEEETLSRTPEEEIDLAYRQMRKSLSQDVLDKVLSLNPSAFEKLVIELLLKMGYGGSIQDAGKAIGRTGDEGIDGTINEDRLGLDVIYIQAKRWQRGNVVGRPEIQKFVGALAGQDAKKGIFITTSNFTKEATDYAKRIQTKVVLIDGEQLSHYMIDYGIGVSTINTYELKRIDNDYFDDF